MILSELQRRHRKKHIRITLSTQDVPAQGLISIAVFNRHKKLLRSMDVVVYDAMLCCVNSRFDAERFELADQHQFDRFWPYVDHWVKHNPS